MSLVFIAAPVHAHVVNDFYAELTSDGDVVRMDILFDASYATPEGNVEDKPQQPRSWLYTLSEMQHRAMCDKAEQIVRHMLRFHAKGDRVVSYKVTFPDYETPTPEFPHARTGGAYFTVRIEVPLPTEGELILNQYDRSYPFFVIKMTTEEVDYLNLYPDEPGKKLPFTRTVLPGEGEEFSNLTAEAGFSAKNLTFFLVDGYRHVIPDGWDHILFILALCLLSLEWRLLLKQSLIFTVAHSITLGLAVAGWLIGTPSIIEPIIALSIAWMAAENFLSEKVGKFRIGMVFVFGLVHGMGFGNMLADKIQASGQFGMALFAANLGVELAQLTVVALALILLGPLQGRQWFGSLRYVLSAAVALAGLYLFFDRI